MARPLNDSTKLSRTRQAMIDELVSRGEDSEIYKGQIEQYILLYGCFLALNDHIKSIDKKTIDLTTLLKFASEAVRLNNQMLTLLEFMGLNQKRS